MLESEQKQIEIMRNFFDMVGNTPIVYFGKYKNSDIYIKLEGYNPTGSLKDRSAVAILNDFHEKGILEGRTIIDASSGSFGCAIAYFGMLMKVPVMVVSNAKLTATNKIFIELTGANLVLHGAVTGESNQYVKNLVNENPEEYAFCDQLNNWASPHAHYEGTGPEILRDLPEVNAIVASMGSGATLWGVGKYFKENNPEVKICASVAKPGTTIAGTFKEDKDYLSPFIQEIREKGYVDFYSAISADEAFQNASKIFQEKGFFVGPQTGGVFQAAMSLIDKDAISGNVLLISGDMGWKNLEKLSEFKPLQ